MNSKYNVLESLKYISSMVLRLLNAGIVSGSEGFIADGQGYSFDVYWHGYGEVSRHIIPMAEIHRSSKDRYIRILERLRDDLVDACPAPAWKRDVWLLG